MSRQENKALRGVNLGGWLVLEPWMTPSVFRDTTAKDEYSLASLGSKYRKRIEKHRNTFITEKDFYWLSQHNIDAVRIPIGYWALKGDGAYSSAVKQLDWAMAMAKKYNLKVLISIHGAPGGQNKKHHSGYTKELRWFFPKNFLRLISFTNEIASRYKDNPSFWGIGLLNEPRTNSILSLFLKLYYRVAIKNCKKIAPQLHIVVSDGFNANKWKGIAGRLGASLDLHIYQSFSAYEKRKNIDWHITHAKKTGRKITSLQKTCDVIVGEWSAVLHPSCKIGYTKSEQSRLINKYVSAQIESYSQGSAWFYWSYKTESGGSWSFRDMISNGTIDLNT